MPCAINRDSTFSFPSFLKVRRIVVDMDPHSLHKETSSDALAFQNGTVVGHRLILATKLVQALLHFVELTLKLVHLVARPWGGLFGRF